MKPQAVLAMVLVAPALATAAPAPVAPIVPDAAANSAIGSTEFGRFEGTIVWDFKPGVSADPKTPKPTEIMMRARPGASVVEYTRGLDRFRFVALEAEKAVFNVVAADEVERLAPDAPVPQAVAVRAYARKTGKSQIILGYLCNEHLIHTPDFIFSLWATTELEVNASPLYQLEFGYAKLGNLIRLVKGVPLVMTNIAGMELRARSIELRRVSASAFAVPGVNK